MFSSALITGASSGLGRALALALAERGTKVALVARGSTEEVAALARAVGGHALALSADVADKTAVYPIVMQAAEAHGPIDLMIHCASTLGPVPLRALAETDCEDLERVLAVNVVGPFRLTKAALGHMVLAERGTIVFVSSDAAVAAYPEWGAYGASKAALDHLARIWAAELAESRVRLLIADPGEMDTPMHAAAMPTADRATLVRPERVAVQLLADLETKKNGERWTVQS